MAKKANMKKRTGGNPSNYRSKKVINSPYTVTVKAPVPDRFLFDIKKIKAPESILIVKSSLAVESDMKVAFCLAFPL